MAEAAQSNIPQNNGTQTDETAARQQKPQTAADIEAEAEKGRQAQKRPGYEADFANVYANLNTVDDQVNLIKDYFKQFAPTVAESKINTLMPVIKREVDELGLSKYENPFIDFIEKYLPSNEMSLPEYTALHNLYSQAVIDEEDVRGTYNKGNQKELTNTLLFNPSFYKYSYTDMILFWNVWKNFRKPNEVKRQLRDDAKLSLSSKEQITDVKNYFNNTREDRYKVIRNIILFQISESEASAVKDIRGLQIRPATVVQTLLSQIVTAAPRATDYRDTEDEDEKDKKNDESFYAVGSIDNAMNGIDKLYQTNKDKVPSLYKYIVEAIHRIANEEAGGYDENNLLSQKEKDDFKQLYKENTSTKRLAIISKIKDLLKQAEYVKLNNYQRLIKEVIARYAPLNAKKPKGANQ